MVLNGGESRNEAAGRAEAVAVVAESQVADGTHWLGQITIDKPLLY